MVTIGLNSLLSDFTETVKSNDLKQQQHPIRKRRKIWQK